SKRIGSRSTRATGRGKQEQHMSENNESPGQASSAPSAPRRGRPRKNNAGGDRRDDGSDAAESAAVAAPVAAAAAEASAPAAEAAAAAPVAAAPAPAAAGAAAPA